MTGRWVISCDSRPKWSKHKRQPVLPTPDAAMAGVLGAYLSLMSTEASSIADARAALGGVAGRPDALAPREQAHLAAAGLWLAGDMMGAGAILADISLRWPRDLLALFVGHQIDFFTGNVVSLRDRIGRAMWAWTPDDRHFGFVQGMYAFGLEECNLYGLSEEMAQCAVEANLDDVWGIHAMVHTYEMQGRIADGVRFMRGAARELGHRELPERSQLLALRPLLAPGGRRTGRAGGL